LGQVERSRNPCVAVADEEPTHSFDFAQDDPDFRWFDYFIRKKIGSVWALIFTKIVSLGQVERSRNPCAGRCWWRADALLRLRSGWLGWVLRIKAHWF